MNVQNSSKTERMGARATVAAPSGADRRRFTLDEVHWQAFQQALDRPVQAKPRLQQLLRAPGLLG